MTRDFDDSLLATRRCQPGRNIRGQGHRKRRHAKEEDGIGRGALSLSLLSLSLFRSFVLWWNGLALPCLCLISARSDRTQLSRENKPHSTTRGNIESQRKTRQSIVYIIASLVSLLLPASTLLLCVLVAFVVGVRPHSQPSRLISSSADRREKKKQSSATRRRVRQQHTRNRNIQRKKEGACGR